VPPKLTPEEIRQRNQRKREAPLTPLKPVIDLLAALGELEWARSVGGIGTRLPLLAWRFKVPNEHLERRIIEAVQSYSGPVVDWSADANGRSWVIGVKNLRVDDADFPAASRAVHDDAVRLAEHLERELATHKPNPLP